MKTMKKLLASLLVGVLLTAAVGCGDSGTNEWNGDGSITDSSTDDAFVYGEWSSWDTAEPVGKEGRKIESQTQYRSREKTILESNRPSIAGGVLVDKVTTTSGVGQWSSWQVTPVTESATCKIETKTQYRSRTVTVSQETSDWSAWSDWEEMSSAPEASANKEVKKRTVYYYSVSHYRCELCGNTYGKIDMRTIIDARRHGIEQTSLDYLQSLYVGGELTNNMTSQEVMLKVNEDPYIEYIYEATTLTSIDSRLSFDSKGVVEVNDDEWFAAWQEPFATKYEYSVRTRGTSEVKNYSEWSEYSDTPITASNSREVETRTMYRYANVFSKTLYYFEVWGSWSDWGTIKPIETDSISVEKRIVYRYADPIG